MNKNDLVERIHGKSGISRTVIRRVLNETMEAIMQAMEDGENITLSGFGSFKTLDKSIRNRKCSEAEELILRQPKKAVCFKAGLAMKARLERKEK